jgi:hypothetical protein
VPDALDLSALDRLIEEITVDTPPTTKVTPARALPL